MGGSGCSCVCHSSAFDDDDDDAMWTDTVIVEGLFTISVSFLLLFFLPGSPDMPRPLLSAGFIRFSKDEQAILKRRLELDGAGRHGENGSRIPLSQVWKTILHYQRWPHYISTFAVFSTWSPLTTYTPSIIL